MPATKRLRFRELALVDVEAATQWYAQQAGERAALGFLDALDAAYAHIERHPATGSPRWGLELEVPDLRSRPLDRFPHLVFYVERANYVEVWRVLHGARDLPAAFAEPPTSAA
jgi:toxin ParE1/3/4